MGGNFIKLLGCWGRKSSGEDWTKEEGKGNYEIIALKMQELCLNFPKKNSGKGVTPFQPPKKTKIASRFFFLGEGNQVENTGGGGNFSSWRKEYTPLSELKMLQSVQSPVVNSV